MVIAGNIGWWERSPMIQNKTGVTPFISQCIVTLPYKMVIIINFLLIIQLLRDGHLNNVHLTKSKHNGSHLVCLMF